MRSRSVGVAAAAAALMAAGAAAGQTAPAPQTPPRSPGATLPAQVAQPPQRVRPSRPPSQAQDARDQAQDRADEAAQVSELTVQATRRDPTRMYGAVVGDIVPEQQLSPADIQSYGVSTVTELLQELAPETRSDRGRTQQQPVVLLNGRRVSSLAEVQNIPAEAILRIDILPEEVALKYGYTADQRVVNIVLRRFFRAVTAEGAGGTTTAGGDPTAQAELDQFTVRRDARTNFDLKYNYAAGLTEAQRGIGEDPGGAPFDFAGNVVSPTGGEIDPALSTMAGKPVTIAGVPASAASGSPPTLAAFVPTAGIANVSDTAADHSLVPASQNISANAVIARPIAFGFNATFNVNLTGQTSTQLQGLPGVSLQVPAGDPFSPFAQPVTLDRYLTGVSPLRQQTSGWTGRVGATFNRDFGSWRFSLTGAYNHGDTITDTGVGIDPTALEAALAARSPSLDPFGVIPAGLVTLLPENRARQITDGANIQVLVNGPLVRLPAGPLYVSAKLGDVIAASQSGSTIADVSQHLGLTRNIGQAQLNLDLPLTSRSRHVLGALGDFAVNANVAVDHYSDFGDLVTLGYGFRWTPIQGTNLIVSEIHDHQAPSLQQLDAPVVATPGVRLFDFATGQTASIAQISGGNRLLRADDRSSLKVELTVRPFANKDLMLTANYTSSHIANALGSLPSANAAIEAAFPSRFVRDADGDLVEEDNRAVNFAAQDHAELRWGFNFTLPVGRQPPPRPSFRGDGEHRRLRPGGPPSGAAAGETPPGGATPGGGPAPSGEDGGPGGAPGTGPGGGGRPPGGFGGGGRGFGGGGRGRGGFGGPPVGGRMQIALYHTIIFKDLTQVTPGGPVIDMLHGSPTMSGGGQYQHELEAQFGYADGGYGVRLSANWRSATTVFGGFAGGVGALRFSAASSVNLRLWDDFNQQRKLVTRYPLLRGTRITLNIANLFNQTQHVTAASGPTPFVYQPGFLNPTGRVISISLRKVFY
jgi:uncharacterized membrane protein YgcG